MATTSTRSTTRPGAGGPAPDPSAKRAVLLGAVAAMAVVGLVVALVVARSGDRPTGDSTAGGGGMDMAHVHGLGIDPADGELVAGTHYGTFRIDADGVAQQVGPVRDFMGFTVAGPRQYLASGHPGAGEDAPANLGLIESTDGGKTWEALSLSGDADFHTLELRHGRVYGHAGGQLMVSEDRKEWDARAALPLADLAVSPDTADTVLATTEQGPALSTDGGRTFEVLTDAPLLLLVSWTDDGTLVGVGPDGSVHASDDDAQTWSARGDVGGPPAALAATGDDVYVARGDGSIVESTDGGETFRVRYRAG